jgi:hypothetical protein
MAETPTVPIRYDGNEERMLVFADGDSELLLLSAVGPDLFRLEESSLLGEGRYHDPIRVSRRDDNSLQFQEIVTPSGLQTEEWILSKDLMESHEFRLVLDWVMSVGGNWEQAFGGLLLVHVPPHVAEMAHSRIAFLRSKSSH